MGTVEVDSPAAKAGFKAGDVIRKIDGTAVSDSTDVTSRIGNTAPGTKVDVEVWREGKSLTLAATVGTLDDAKVASAKEDAEAEELGVAVRPLTPEEKKDGGKSGVVVDAILEPIPERIVHGIHRSDCRRARAPAIRRRRVPACNATGWDSRRRVLVGRPAQLRRRYDAMAAPAVGVVPVHRRAAEARLAGAGSILEHSLRLRRRDLGQRTHG